MTSPHGGEDGRSELEDLLPWHAAGTLSRGEAQRVDQALARDPELARRYDLVREELAATTHLNETLGAPSARALDRLFAAIDAEPARRSMPLGGIGERISSFLAGLSPRTLAWATSAAALVILAQGALIGGVVFTHRTTTTEYHTASAPSSAPAATGSIALVRFAPDASMAEVTKFLDDNKAAIVSGPAADGFYRVRVSPTVMPKDKLTDTVKRLQQAKVVDFIAASR